MKNADARFLKVFFGFCITAISIEMFLRERQNKKAKSSKLVLGIIGVISGILCGLFGIGAFLAAYVSRTTYNQKEFKGNLCFVFFIENSFRLILYIATGIIDISIIKTALCLIPFAILGLFLGTILSNKSSEKFIKNLVISLLLLSGVSLIINNMNFITCMPFN